MHVLGANFGRRYYSLYALCPVMPVQNSCSTGVSRSLRDLYCQLVKVAKATVDELSLLLEQSFEGMDVDLI